MGQKKKADKCFSKVLEEIFNNQDITDEQIVEMWNREDKYYPRRGKMEPEA